LIQFWDEYTNELARKTPPHTSPDSCGKNTNHIH